MVRVRFAPSPTGYLHIGGLRTAIFNWLFARHAGGQFLLRIEDTDVARSQERYTQAILESLSWCGLDWDQEPVIQSQRIDRHRQMVNQLLAQGQAYYCYCTTSDIEKRLWAGASQSVEYRKYDGHCRGRNEPDTTLPAAIRFKLPEQLTFVEFDDMIRGTIIIGADQLDDFIIVRSDGTPMYNFVVVVDDADMGITHVIRGEEHIPNTPKQILLYRACGFKLPTFAHLPMILGPDGNKLSKRDAATSVTDYKHKGYLPEALFNYLVRLGWAHGDQEIFTKQEMIALFSLEAVGKKGAIFNQEKLDWINGVYMQHVSAGELIALIVSDVDPLFMQHSDCLTAQQRERLVALYVPRTKTVEQVALEVQSVCTTYAFDPAVLNALHSSNSVAHLKQLRLILETIDPFTPPLLNASLKEYAQTQGLKLVALAHPLRTALIGKPEGPGVFELMAILGKQESLRRLEALLAAL